MGNFFGSRSFAEKSYKPLKFGKIVKKSKISRPGIEPGPPGWKAGVLSIRPREWCICGVFEVYDIILK